MPIKFLYMLWTGPPVSLCAGLSTIVMCDGMSAWAEVVKYFALQKTSAIKIIF